jgi:hypothetical protein
MLLTATITPAVAFDKLEEVMVITQIHAPAEVSEEQKE